MKENTKIPTAEDFISEHMKSEYFEGSTFGESAYTHDEVVKGLKAFAALHTSEKKYILPFDDYYVLANLAKRIQQAFKYQGESIKLHLENLHVPYTHNETTGTVIIDMQSLKDIGLTMNDIEMPEIKAATDALLKSIGVIENPNYKEPEDGK